MLMLSLFKFGMTMLCLGDIGLLSLKLAYDGVNLYIFFSCGFNFS